MVNTVPFKAHTWKKPSPGNTQPRIVAFIHQTCEEIWNYNAPKPANLLGRYILEPRWLKTYNNRPLLAVSQSTKDSLTKNPRFNLPSNPITIVPEGHTPHPIPDKTRNPYITDQPTLIWAARHVPYKQPNHAIDAYLHAKKHIPNLQLWMIGGGPDLEKTRSYAAKHDDPNIHVLGRVPEEEKHQRMQAAHLHIATSIREGWGLVVTEAAAQNTPTLAYNTPGLKDSTEAAHGQLTPPTPEALAAWIPAALNHWKNNPYRTPNEYGGAESWETVAHQVLQAATQPQPQLTPNRKLALQTSNLTL